MRCTETSASCSRSPQPEAVSNRSTRDQSALWLMPVAVDQHLGKLVDEGKVVQLDGGTSGQGARWQLTVAGRL